MKRIFAALLAILILCAIIVVARTEIISTKDLTLDMLKSRKGTVCIEKCIGIVSEDNGGLLLNGDANNYYISYTNVSNANEGDIILTYFVYNPFNNVEDDIIWRIDFVL